MEEIRENEITEFEDWEVKSRVYVKMDAEGRIIQIEGEYSLSNLDLTDPNVVQIDEGTPCDRLNHAQSGYLEGGLWTEDGIPRWTLEDAEPWPVPVLRSEEELQADREALQRPVRIAALKEELSATDYKIIKCSEYRLAGLELPYDVAALHAQRQALRDEINALEGTV